MPVKNLIAVTLLSVALIGCGQDDRNPTENLTETSTPAPLFSDEEIARWEASADEVTILRDTWGIAHIYGVTDADTVFGTLYAQAEDDFYRLETNYINAMGRLAEAEGETQLYLSLIHI